MNELSALPRIVDEESEDGEERDWTFVSSCRAVLSNFWDGEV